MDRLLPGQRRAGVLNVLGLCAGVGGLELGIRLAEPTARVVCYVEREVYPIAVTLARIQDGLADDAPVWDDLRTFDGRPWRGSVDCISAGFPCQPFSVAGKRRGTADERWLWPDIARIIRGVGPRFVFLENPTGILSGGLGHVLGDLAALGFDAEWNVCSAAARGAPHIRRRLFILADASGIRPFPGSSGASQEILESGGLAGQHVRFWEAESQPSGVDDGVAFRLDRIRACGNGVVPAVAALAWRTLRRQLDG